MPVLTAPADITRTKHRAALRAELAQYDDLKVEYLRLIDQRNAIQARIDRGELTAAAHRQNNAEIDRVRSRLRGIAKIPNELVATAPEELRQTFRDRLADKSTAIARRTKAQQSVEQAEQELHVSTQRYEKANTEGWPEEDHARRRRNIADLEHELRTANRALAIAGEDEHRALQALEDARQACIED